MIFTEQEIERFWSKVDVREANKCWLWKAGKIKGGYGGFKTRGRKYQAHRVAWTLTNGRAPREGYEICHAPIICHNPACCNPAHLSEKTRQENIADTTLDGTTPRAIGERNGAYTHPEKRVRNFGERNGQAKLSQTQVDEIRALRKQGIVQHVIAKMFGINQSHVSDITTGKKRA